MLESIAVGCVERPSGQDAMALGADLADASGARLTIAMVAAAADSPTGAPGERTLVIDVWPARGLRRLAQSERVDVIVVGSSSRARAGRVCAGEVPRQLLEDGPCAVAVAPRGYRERRGRLERVVVGFDGSAEGRAALVAAHDLAAQVGGRLRVLAVAEDARAADPLGRHARDEAPRDAEVSVVVGEPAAELARAGEGADVLVLGSHQRTPPGQVAVGGTSYALLRDGPCTVLVVPRSVVVPPFETSSGSFTATG